MWRGSHRAPVSVNHTRPEGWEVGTLQPFGAELDKGEFEIVKTRFYNLEGWDPAAG